MSSKRVGEITISDASGLKMKFWPMLASGPSQREERNDRRILERSVRLACVITIATFARHSVNFGVPLGPNLARLAWINGRFVGHS